MIVQFRVITAEEVADAYNLHCYKKTPGMDKIATEFLKILPDVGIAQLAKEFKRHIRISKNTTGMYYTRDGDDI